MDSVEKRAEVGMNVLLHSNGNRPCWVQSRTSGNEGVPLVVPSLSRLKLTGRFHLCDPSPKDVTDPEVEVRSSKKHGKAMAICFIGSGQIIALSNLQVGTRAIVKSIGQPALKKVKKKYFILNGHKFPC